MMKKTGTIVIIGLLFCSMFALFNAIKPVAATDWTTVNDDPNLVGPDSPYGPWFQSPGDNTQNIDLVMSMDNGATTRMDSTAGYGVWSNAALGQWISVPATYAQRVSFTVKPYYERMDGTSFFDIYFEVWLEFSSSTGNNGFTGAELMLKQRVITTGTAPANNSYDTVDTVAGWYRISYRLPDIQYNAWTSCGPYDMNALLINKLYTYFGVDLSLGTVAAVDIGIEGNSADGGMGAQWSSFNYQSTFEPYTYSLTVDAYDEYLHETSETNVYVDDNYVGTVGWGQPVSTQVMIGDHTVTLDYRAYNIGWNYETAIQRVDANCDGYYNIYSETPVTVYLLVTHDTTVNAVYSWDQNSRMQP